MGLQVSKYSSKDKYLAPGLEPYRADRADGTVTRTEQVTLRRVKTTEDSEYPLIRPRSDSLHITKRLSKVLSPSESTLKRRSQRFSSNEEDVDEKKQKNDSLQLTKRIGEAITRRSTRRSKRYSSNEDDPSGEDDEQNKISGLNIKKRLSRVLSRRSSKRKSQRDSTNEEENKAPDENHEISDSVFADDNIDATNKRSNSSGKIKRIPVEESV